MSELDQKITTFDLWHLALPVTSRRAHGSGEVAGACEIVVLRLGSEGGVEGFGEAAPWTVFTGMPEACFAALDRYLRPLVIGRPVAARNAIMQAADAALAHAPEAKACLETALLDLAGRVLGLPVWALLGGKCREQIALSCSIADPDFARDLTLLQRLRDDGIRMIKLKAGFADHGFDLMRLERIAGDFPDFRLRIDYNQGLRPDNALACLRDVAEFRPDFIEQPVRAALPQTMARLRDASAVPLLADESVFGPEDMARAARDGICDGVSVKIMKAGGIERARTVARIAAAHGLSAYGGDMFESGLAHLAGAHMIAATPEISLGCEFYQARYFLIDDILETPFPIAGGAVTVPDGPGLGIRPDVQKLTRFARMARVAP